MGRESGDGRRGARMSDTDVADLVEQVSGVLDELHSAGGVHGDLKPASVDTEQDSSGRIRSFWFRDSDGDGAAYRAPEAWGGGRSVAASDQYALACIAFEWLTGSPPFGTDRATGDRGPRFAHVSAPVPTIGGTRAELGGLDKVFVKALSKSQFDRYPSCGAFASALRAGVEETQKATGDKPVRRPGRTIPPKRSRVIVDVDRIMESAAAQRNQKLRRSIATPAPEVPVRLHRTWRPRTRAGRPVITAVLACVGVVVLAVVGLTAGSTVDGGAVVAPSAVRGAGSSVLSAAIVWASDELADNRISVGYATDDSGRAPVRNGDHETRFWVSPFPVEGADLAHLRSACTKFTQFPLLFAPLGIAHPASGIGPLTLDRELIAGIFGGTITEWRDPQIVARNSSAMLPTHRIYSIGSVDEWAATTMQRFMWADGRIGWKHWMRPAEPDAGMEHMTGRYQVSRGSNSIAYVSTEQSEIAPVGFAAVDFGAGPVGPTAQATRKAVESVSADMVDPGEIVVDYRRLFTSRVPGTYPLMAPVHAVVCHQDDRSDAETAALQTVLSTIVAMPDKKAVELGYVPLPPQLRSFVHAKIDRLY